MNQSSLDPRELWGLPPQTWEYTEQLAQRAGISLALAAITMAQVIKPKPLWHNSAR